MFAPPVKPRPTGGGEEGEYVGGYGEDEALQDPRAMEPESVTFGYKDRSVTLTAEDAARLDKAIESIPAAQDRQSYY